ncbi:MAG: PEP/pyruvate-binding domain-containing protein [Chloroflexota bacterium]
MTDLARVPRACPSNRQALHLCLGRWERRGQRDDEGPARRQGAEPRRDDLAGLPTPPGVHHHGQERATTTSPPATLPAGLWEDVLGAVTEVEQRTGKGCTQRPRPTRSWSRSARVPGFSMPGMMDTVLSLGLNEQTLQGLIALSGNERFGWDAYRRFIGMFGRIVMGVEAARFDEPLENKHAHGPDAKDTDLTVDDLRALVGTFKQVVRDDTGTEFPDDPYQQLDLAIKAVFASWFGKRANDYRNGQKIAHDLGTAVNVVTMVFGNMGDDSGTGVAFTRNTFDGTKGWPRRIPRQHQGEDVVANIRTPEKVAHLKDQMPEAYDEFVRIGNQLEAHYKDVQDLEFTVTRPALRSRPGCRSEPPRRP